MTREVSQATSVDAARTTLTIGELQNEVLYFLSATAAKSPKPITPETNLLEVYSMNLSDMAKFLAFIELRTGTEIAIVDFDLNTIRSISSIHRYFCR